MKKLGIILAAVAAVAIASGPALAKKAAPKPKKLSQGWAEEISKAKWHWKAPAKGKAKKK
jgi:hypothetical protein